MDADKLEELLTQFDYDKDLTQFLVKGFKEGFDLGYRGEPEVQLKSPNLKLTVGSKTELWNKVMKEVQAKRYAGPFSEIPFNTFIQSPIGLVPKDENKTRLIFHLSFPRGTGKSVNENTPEELKTVKYKDIDQAVRICLKKGSKRLYASKSDMTAAFRHCPIRKEFWKYLIMKAQSPLDGKWYYFVDKCLPFGAAISCSVFQKISDSISFLVSAITGEENVNYLDDYLFIAVLKNMCNWQLDTFLQVCKDIQFPVSLEKTFRARRKITFLGLLLDLLNGRISIPVTKIVKAKELINRMLNSKRKKTTLRELQQLCGFLNFISKAIVPGRTFTRRLYAQGDGILKPHHHLAIKQEMKQDLRMWLQFLDSSDVYSREFYDFNECATFTQLEFFTDASRNPNLGCGGICGKEWYILQWNKKFICDVNPSIAYLELYGLTIGLISWLKDYRNKRICVFCDNQSVVAMVNKMTSKCKNCMVLIRILMLHCLRYNVKIRVAYVESKKNTYADHLSRLRYKEFRALARKERKYFLGKPTPIPDILHPMEQLWLN